MDSTRIRNQVINLASNGISKEDSVVYAQIFSSYNILESDLAVARMYEFFLMNVASIFSESFQDKQKSLFGSMLLQAEEEGVACNTPAEIAALLRKEIPVLGENETTPGELSILTGLYSYGLSLKNQDADFSEIFIRSWCEYFIS